MHSIIYLGILFIAKVIDNAINTTKTIMIQRSRWVLAGIAVILSDFIYFWIMRNVVTSDNMLTMLIVAVAGGVGCSLACFMNDKLSKDRTYVNVIMSDNLEAMKNGSTDVGTDKGYRSGLCRGRLRNISGAYEYR